MLNLLNQCKILLAVSVKITGAAQTCSACFVKLFPEQTGGKIGCCAYRVPFKKRLAWVVEKLLEHGTIYAQKTTTCDRTVAEFPKFMLE